MCKYSWYRRKFNTLQHAKNVLESYASNLGWGNRWKYGRVKDINHIIQDDYYNKAVFVRSKLFR